MPESIVCLPHEARDLHAGTLGLIVRPVKCEIPIVSVGNREIWNKVRDPMLAEMKATSSLHVFIGERGIPDGVFGLRSPFGAPGAVLWGKEAFGIGGDRLIDPCINYRADGVQSPINRGKGVSSLLWYASHRPAEAITAEELLLPSLLRTGWYRSTEMPRWVSRFPALTFPRQYVKRLHEITEDEARAWGCKSVDYTSGRECILDPTLGSRKLHARELWDASFPKFPWASNPWCWFGEVKRG